MNNKTSYYLIHTLKGGKVKARRKQFWDKVSYSSSLEGVLKGLTIKELQHICKNLEIEELSDLNKVKLIEKLVELVPKHFKQVLFLIDKEIYHLLSEIKTKGYVKADSFPFNKVETLMYYCLAFPGRLEGEKILMMPEELLAVFKQEDGKLLKRRTIINTKYITHTYQHVYFYDRLFVDRAIFAVEKLTKTQVDDFHYFKLMEFATNYYQKIVFKDVLFHRIRETEKWSIFFPRKT